MHLLRTVKRRMNTLRKPNDLLPLTSAVFHILLVLADGENHGYGIMQDVVKVSGGHIRMGPGTLYGSIKRMLDAGLIEETDAPVHDRTDDERRRYYKLTDFGERVVTAEAQRLAHLVNAATVKRLLGSV